MEPAWSLNKVCLTRAMLTSLVLPANVKLLSALLKLYEGSIKAPLQALVRHRHTYLADRCQRCHSVSVFVLLYQ
jgi:hypothetical protein